MPSFAYTARDDRGQIVRTVLEAPSRKDAMRVLLARGLQVLDLNEAGAAAARRSVAAVAPAPFSHRERLPFLQALADLTTSGMPAGEAVRLLSQRLKAPALKSLCTRLWERLGEGLSLSQALAAHPLVFDPQTINLVAAGEATGNLKEVLARLIQHFTEQRDLRRKLTAALAYPVFVCLLAVAVVLFFMFYLMPRLQTLLASLGGQLPLATRLLVGLSEFLLSYGVLVLLALALGAGFFWQWRRGEAGRRTTDAWLLRVPLAGRYLTNATVHNFSETLAVLLENGVTTADALRMTERTIAHRTLRRAFGEATDRVLEGEKISLALGQTGCFPDLVLDRLAVGESTGNLAPSLRDIARTYRQEMTDQLHAFSTIVASAVLLLAFTFVAFIAYAIIAAVFQVSASFKF